MNIPSDLRSTDWILHRWAASVGDGLRDVVWEDVPVSRVPLLNDQTAIVVDQLVMRAARRTRKLVELKYRTVLPKTVIAKRVGIDIDVFDHVWHTDLRHFRGMFLSSPLSDLRFIAAVDVGDLVRQVSERSRGACNPSYEKVSFCYELAEESPQSV